MSSYSTVLGAQNLLVFCKSNTYLKDCETLAELLCRDPSTSLLATSPVPSSKELPAHPPSLKIGPYYPYKWTSDIPKGSFDRNPKPETPWA